MKKIFVAAALATLGSTAFAADNLIQNGDFENYSVTVPNGSFATVNAGTNGLTDWTIGGTSVDLVKGNYGAITGTSVDMLGTPGPGSLSQSFATVVGQTYLLSFDLSNNNGGVNGTQPAPNLLAVSFNGGPATNFYGTTTPITPYTMQFQALGTLTSLTFSSAATGYSGAVLDNVSVTAVPEPASYAMLLAGLGIMGAVARRSKSRI